MAIVGQAYIVVRAITNQVRDDINKGFNGTDRAGGDAGSKAGSAFSQNFSRSMGRSGGGGGIFSNLMADAQGAGDKLNSLIVTGYSLGPAIAGIVSVAGAAAAGLFALGAQAAAAAPALFALVNVFSAVAQGAVVLKVALSGVGAALSASGKSTGGAARDNAKQIEAAFERIQDARKRVAQVVDANNRRELEAGERIVELIERQEEAFKNIGAAQLEVVEAENEVLKAQEETTKAREEAIEAIQQLRFELEEAVLSEQRAVLGFEDARKALAKVQNLPPNNRARREAELAFAEADLKLRRAKDNNLDTQKEVEQANAKGVEGSDQVVAALENEARAQKNKTKAQNEVIAKEKAYAAAVRDTEKARRNLARIEQENIAREAEARAALEKAKEAYDDAKNASTGAAGGVDQFAEAMKNLSPSAQGFVRDMIAIKPELKEIKLLTQEAFFSVIRDDIKELTDTWLPKLKKLLPETGRILGEVGEKIIGVFTAPDNVSQLTGIFKSNDKIIESFGGAVANLADVFVDLMDAAAPLAKELAEFVEKITEGWKQTVNAKRETGELSGIFTEAGKVAKDLGKIFGDLFSSIFNIGKAASGPDSGGAKLLEMLSEVTGKFKEFTGSEEGQARLTKFFQNIVPAVSKIGGFIGDIFKEFLKLTEYATTTQEGGPKGGPLGGFLTSLREVVRILAETGPSLVEVLPTIGRGLESAAQVITNLTSSGALEAFFGFLADFVNVAKKITDSELFQKIFAVVAPAFALSRAFSLVAKFVRFIFLGAIVSNVAKFAGAFHSLRAVIQTIGLVFGVGSGPVVLFIAAIAGLVAIFIAMYNESEIFRKAIKDLIDGVIAKAITVFETLKTKLEKALEPLGGTTGAVDKLKKAFKFLGDIIGTYIVPFFEATLKNALEIIGGILGTIIDTIGGLIAAFMRIFNGIKTGDVSEIFGGIVDAIFAPFKALVSNVIDLFKNMFNNVIEAVKKVLGISSPSTVFTEIATNILDTIINIITFLPNKFLQIFTTMWTNIADFFTNTIGPGVLSWGGQIGKWLKGIWDKLFEKLKDVWGKVVEYFGPGGVVGTFLISLPAKVVNWVKGIWDGIFSALATVYKKIVDFFGYDSDIGRFIRGLGATIKTWASTLWSGLTNGLTTAVTLIKNGLRPIATILNLLIAGANFVATATGSSFRITPIPDFAEGGTVFPRAGGVIARVAEAGRPERIEPLDSDGLSKRDKAMINMLSGGNGGGTTINVYPSEGMNERELAEMVSRELAFMMRRGGI